MAADEIGPPRAATGGDDVAGTEPLAGPVRMPYDERALAELADLDTAREELRVVEAEVATQQRTILALLERYESERRWRAHFGAVAPVGLCVTDGDGQVLDANPALAVLLQVSLGHVRGKPLSVYLEPSAVPGFRDALRALASGSARHHEARLELRGRERTSRVALVGFLERGHARRSHVRIQWVLAEDAADRSSLGSADEEPPLFAMTSALVEISRLPVDEDDPQRLVSRLAVLVRCAVPAASSVSLSLGSPAEPHLIGTDSPEAQEFDGRQMQAQEGPCWEACTTRRTVLVSDVTTDPRWPALARLATAGRVRSVLAVPLAGPGADGGVLNLYAAAVGAFDAYRQHLAPLIATAVSATLETVSERAALRELAGNLERALSSRAVIDQAKGVLMARLGIDADEAFARMVRLSNRLNVKVRDLAGLLIGGHADEVLSADV